MTSPKAQLLLDNGAGSSSAFIDVVLITLVLLMLGFWDSERRPQGVILGPREVACCAEETLSRLPDHIITIAPDPHGKEATLLLDGQTVSTEALRKTLSELSDGAKVRLDVSGAAPYAQVAPIHDVLRQAGLGYEERRLIAP